MTFQTWRVKLVLGYCFLLGLGVALGIIGGHIFVDIVWWMISPDNVHAFVMRPDIYPYLAENGQLDAVDELYDVLAQVRESEMVRFVAYRICEGAGALWLGNRVAQAQGLYQELCELKHQHELTFFAVRHMNPIRHTPLKEMVWAVSFVLTDIFLPPTLSVLLGWLTFHLFWLKIRWFAFIPAWVVAKWAPPHFTLFVQQLFQREDLQYELENAPLMLATLAHIAEEEKVLRELESSFPESEQQYDTPQLSGRGNSPLGQFFRILLSPLHYVFQILGRRKS